MLAATICTVTFLAADGDLGDPRGVRAPEAPLPRDRGREPGTRDCPRCGQRDPAALDAVDDAALATAGGR